MSGIVQLTVNPLQARDGELYQCLEIATSGKIEPELLGSLTLPRELDFSKGIILWGAAPIWLTSHLVQRCDSAPWVGCYDLQLGSVVVVASRIPELAAAESFRLVPSRPPGPALFIGGPPNSGKSVLSYALVRGLRGANPNRRIHLHRAQWDGEGNWAIEAKDRALVDSLRQQHKAGWSERFFQHHAEAVGHIREAMDLVLVDFGGKPKPRDVMVLHRCTHYLIITSDPEALAQWHDFCQVQGKLTPVAVIHSVLEDRVEVLQTEPFLEIIAGPWMRGESARIPDALLSAVMRLLAM
ncbi:CRISPR-associated ring nuclease Crn3/Csx3 [Laspinema olomoucense]|uniref:CRISPR-associated ring nuclease Crn3/Csx3 n=1 Tax=Laspinema olomoucense D3b TaxID=2953688 RepID=A0ABT2N9I4_9CYAN|nr:CRISPR-associated ring nuclease Crn3/Csx3 [Laspinema sp. D3b]MCT7979361.1 CRISPR-associated ring nuclease Crn3/Csx3 [Laspinema sp. D3b]